MPRDVELRRERRAAGQDELRRQVDLVHVLVDERLELGRHLGRDAADAVLEALGGLGRRRELGAGDEELVLDSQDVGGELGVVAGERAGDAQGGVRLVERSVRVGAPVVLCDPAPVPERGGPVVALAGVDPHHGREATPAG